MENVEPSMPEFKLIAGKGKRRGAVAVGGIFGEVRQRSHRSPFRSFPWHRMGCRFNGLQNRSQLVAQEHRDDGGRRLVSAQPVIVARAGDRDAQQILMFVHRLDHRAQDQEELCVVLRRFARLQQVDAGIGRDGPVVVLAAAVDTGKRLFRATGTPMMRSATFFITSMVSWLWSVAMLVVLKMGANSCCAAPLRCAWSWPGCPASQLLVQILHECGHARRMAPK